MKSWYIVQAQANAENQVVKALQARIQLAHLEDKFGEILVPAEEVVEIRKGQKRRASRKFFPGYIFMELESGGEGGEARKVDSEAWYAINQTPKVIGFIGGSKEAPAPVSLVEIKKIKDRLNITEGKPQPKVLYEQGESIRISGGPFADFEGVIDTVDYKHNKARVNVLVFGRATPIDIDFADLQKEV